jgi:superfamily II DNA or RNA helicase
VLRITEPTKLRITGLPIEEVRRALTYIDKGVDYEIQKHRNNRWFLEKHGEELWTTRLNELKSQREQCLLFEDEQGHWTLTGCASTLQERFNDRLINEVHYPEPRPIPWNKTPPPLRLYQDEAESSLYENKHAAVSMGTGLGKSFIIMHLCRNLGLRAVVMAPLTSIAEQLYDDFLMYLGPKYVGFYGSGKKQTNKLITIAIAQSLAKIEPGSADFEVLSKTQVFIADESHQTPAKTFARVCLGIFAQAPYRFFFSGTQTRNDGSELLLQGIIGPIVYTKSVREGVDEGWLARPIFKFYEVESPSPFYSRDANAMTRHHLYYNPRVNSIAGQLSNLSMKHFGSRVLILVDEMEQFAKLLPHFRYEAGFAHGGVTKDNRGKVPEEFHKSDPKALVKRFNALELPILVGTSCISTGVDIKPCKMLINLRGGKSEIELGQGLGRGTRLFELGDYKKTSFTFVDFDVNNIDTIHRHAQARMKMCDTIYGPVKRISS